MAGTASSWLLSPRLRWTAVGLVAAAILVVSVVPIPTTVGESDPGGVSTSLLFHLAGYAGLAWLLATALLGGGRPVRSAGLAFAGASSYGAAIECVQWSLPYRTFSFDDMAVNATGVALAVIVRVLIAWVAHTRSAGE